MQSTPGHTALPALGPALTSWAPHPHHKSGQRSLQRDPKLGLWSAVALQQHFMYTGGATTPTLPSLSLSDGGSGHLPAAVRRAGGGGVEDLRAQLGPGPSILPRNRATLAQRMGLVPAPPAPPTEDDWRAVVHRAVLREQQQQQTPHRDGLWGSSVCGICLNSYATTRDQGQIILSCSHVFHELCFAQFERCIRSQQRADGAGLAEITAPLACPQCRTQHYHKRTFFEGRALAQRAAVVRVQAVVRGFLARRAYTKQRLQCSPGFRRRYITERLARLSAAWETFCATQDRRRDAVLAALTTQAEAATAAYLTEEEWASIRAKTMLRYAGRGGEASCACCPICLESIASDGKLWNTLDGGTADSLSQRRETNVSIGSEGNTCSSLDAGELVVAQMRENYLRRRDEQQQRRHTSTYTSPSASSAQKSATVKTTAKTAGPRRFRASGVASVPARDDNRQGGVGASRSMGTQRRMGGSMTSSKRRSGGASANPAQRLVSHGQPTPHPPKNGGCSSAEGPVASSVPPTVEAGAASVGVLLSCGHCFHKSCLSSYERYAEWQALGITVAGSRENSCAVVCSRCPICRCGYAKHDF